MRLTAIIAAALAGIAPAITAIPAQACLFAFFIPADEAGDIAANGYLVRASVVRGYDAEAHRPELLKIEKVLS